MSINTYIITENKTTENTKGKKDNILDIKQNLFQQMTTQSSRKFKNRDNDENTFSSPKYQKNKNIKNYEENKSIYYDNNEKSMPKDGLKHKSNQKSTGMKSEKKRNRNRNKKISSIKNDNDIMTYFSKNQNKNGYPLNDSNSNENEKNNNFDTDKFNNNTDLIYILSTQKDGSKNTDENDNELDNYEGLTSHVALPFCHYHKYNIKLPKQYTCNFKNCSCCGCLQRKKLQNFQDSNRYKNKPDYIYPVINSEKKKTKFRSVLDKFRKNKNINTLSGESNQLGDSRLIFSKPNNTNLKIAKKDYIIENSNDGSDSNDNNNDIENGKDYYYIDDNIKNENDYNLNDENRLYGDNKSKNGNEYYNDNNENNNNYYYNDNYNNDSNNDNNGNENNNYNDNNFNVNNFNDGDNLYKNGNKYYKNDNDNNNYNDDEYKDKNENDSQNKNSYTNKDENDEINNNIYRDNKLETEYNNNSNDNFNKINNDSNNDNNNDDNAFNKNKINNIYKDENYITEKESENNFDESSLLELPYDCNDDTNLNRYKHLVNKSEKKPKLHLSVMYYKRLNKSFNQVYSKDLKNKRSKSNINFKGVNKNKRVEFLRE